MESKTVVSILSGMIVGTLIGVLFAPAKGSKTRKRIRAKGEEYAEDFKGKFEDVYKDLSDKYESLLEEIRQMNMSK